MRAVIDRFEGLYAVCELETGEIVDIEIERIPAEAKEGDVLIIDDKGIVIDIQETENRSKKIKKLMDDLWK